jgi:hypothetical protein
MANRPAWTDEGLLSISGYRVGQTNGVSERHRRMMLNYVFMHDDLSDISNFEYALQWGEAGTDARLQKLANCLAAFARNALRRNHCGYRRAIKEWTDDLAYLKETFYDRWADFPWPQAEIPEGW